MTATTDAFVEGSIAALDAFRAELLRFRGEIENETEPALDVVIDLLDRSISNLIEKLS